MAVEGVECPITNLGSRSGFESATQRPRNITAQISRMGLGFPGAEGFVLRVEGLRELGDVPPIKDDHVVDFMAQVIAEWSLSLSVEGLDEW